jgi:tRNA pseudouridine55 synthase
MDGFVVVDKPGGMTSHDVVARMRRVARTRRVGHGGTLDPMATGVLVIGIGRATRLLSFAADGRKGYLGTVRLGQTTVTDDAEGEVTGTAVASDVSDDAIAAALEAFRGEIQQVPSAVSAIKVNGVRSYARVRQGQEVALPARPITIYRLSLLAIRRDGPTVDVDLDVECSAGTYVRAVARDLGSALGVGGHLTALRRTAVGDFALAGATPLSELLAENPPPVPVLPLPEVAARLFPRRDASPDEARVLSHGGPLPPIGVDGPYAVFAPDGSVIAIVAERDGLARAQVVLSPAGASDSSGGEQK